MEDQVEVEVQEIMQAEQEIVHQQVHRKEMMVEDQQTQ
jgi:hypothetical protein